MKRIFILTILLILVASICYAGTPLKTYKNTDFQFEISYPHEWTILVTSPKLNKFIFGKHVGDLIVTISPTKGWRYMGVITNHALNITSNDPYSDEILDDLITRSLDFPLGGIAPKFVSKSLVTINDMKAMQLISRIPRGYIRGKSPELLDETYFIYHNNYWYEISFGGTAEEFKTNRQLFDESLKSFKFLLE